MAKSEKRKNPHAVALGRKGGKKGGKKGGRARWEGLTAEQRSEIARRAVQARWAKAKAATKDAPGGTQPAKARGRAKQKGG